MESGSCINREVSPTLFASNFAVLARQYFVGFCFRDFSRQILKQGIQFRDSSLLNLMLFFKISILTCDDCTRDIPRKCRIVVGTALHRYRRGHGFKFRTGLNFFSGLIFTTALVVFITTKIAVHIYDFEYFRSHKFFTSYAKSCKLSPFRERSYKIELNSKTS